MNNCPKCGNPLQEGTSSCPICGTNIVEKKTEEVASVAVPVTSPAAEPAKEAAPAEPTAPAEPAKEVAPENAPAKAETPVAPAAEAPAPVAEPAPAEPAPAQTAEAKPAEAAQPQAETPVSPVEAPVAQEAPAAEAPAAEPVQAPVAEPAQAPAAPVAPTESATPVAPAAPVAPTTPGEIAPTVERVEAPTPVPGIPTSVNNQIVINPDQPLVANPKLQPKKKPKPAIIIGVSVLIIAVIVGVILLNPGKKSNKKGNNTSGEDVAYSSMTSNGYQLRLIEGWKINEDGNNVVITNPDSTVAMKLDHSEANLEKVSQDQIQEVMNSNSSYQNVEVNEISLSGRNSYLISTNINDIPVQIYFINGGTNLVLGATIVYQSDESKSKYESSITEMIGSLTYSEDSIKAIETISQYSEMFGIFRRVSSVIPREENTTIRPDVPDPEIDYNNENNNEYSNENNEENNNGNSEQPTYSEDGNTPVSEEVNGEVTEEIPNNPET